MPTVSLRAVRESDFEALCEQQLDPEAAQMAAVRSREREECFEHWRNALADDANYARVIDVDGECAGHVVTFLRDGVEPREVGYWLARSHWGRGVATTALAAFLEEETRRPLVAGVAIHNMGSRRVLEKCGFTMTETQTNPKGDGIDEWRFRLD